MHDTERLDTMVTEREMVEACMCNKVRAAARAVSNAYDEALRPAGLRASQLAVLAAIALEGSRSITALADMLGMDRSTLSRNLGPLEEAGLIQVGAEGWRRSRTLEITKKGRTQLAKAAPFWESAQAELRRRLGDKSWTSAESGLARLIGATT